MLQRITESELVSIIEDELNMSEEDMLMENYLQNAWLIEAEKGSKAPLSGITDKMLRGEIQKMLEEGKIWQINEEQKDKPKFTFKFNRIFLNDIQRLCARWAIPSQLSAAEKRRITFSNKTLDSYKDYFLKFVESGGSGKVNKGNAFEDEIVARMEAVRATPINCVYHIDKDVYNIMRKAHVVQILAVTKRGGENQKRTLDILNPSANNFDIGKTVTDIDLTGQGVSAGFKVARLSLKVGRTITYINKGIKKWLPNNQMLNCALTPGGEGDKLLEMLGMPEGSKEREMFFAIYNGYASSKAQGISKTEIVDLSNKMDTANVAILTKASIGYGYIKVHQLGNEIHVTKYDQKELAKYNSIKSAIANFTMGKKTFEILLTFSSGKRCKITFRNTAAGVYPTHFLLYWVAD